MVNIFRNDTKTVPKSDPQIVRVDMEQADIGGRKSALPNQEKSSAMTVEHVPNQGSSTGNG